LSDHPGRQAMTEGTITEFEEATLKLAQEIIDLCHTSDDGVVMVKALSLALGYAIASAPDSVRGKIEEAALLQIKSTMAQTVDMGLAGRGLLIQ
jgi:hypothetical protein